MQEDKDLHMERLQTLLKEAAVLMEVAELAIAVAVAAVLQILELVMILSMLELLWQEEEEVLIHIVVPIKLPEELEEAQKV